MNCINFTVRLVPVVKQWLSAWHYLKIYNDVNINKTWNNHDYLTNMCKIDISNPLDAAGKQQAIVTDR